MPGLVAGLLTQYLVRWSVWKVPQTFPNQQLPQTKFVIILCQNSKQILYLIPTSKGAYYQQHKASSAFAYCAPGGCPFFSLPTWIGCDKLYDQDLATFTSLATNGKVGFEGILPNQLQTDVENQIKASRVLTGDEKQMALGAC